jgi:hypothetical protein
MKHEVGNLLEHVKQGIILQQVNAQNAMGSGFAKAVYEKWPIVKTEFHRWSCTFQRDIDRMGKVLPVLVEPGLWVVNIVGQRFAGRHPVRYTSYDALDDGLQTVRNWMDFSGFNPTGADVHQPLLGSDLGGGHWPVVAALIEHRIGPETTLWTLK